MASLFIASNARAMSISPVRYLATMKPGKQAAVIVTIKNDKAETVNYNLLVLGAEQNNEGHPIFQSGISAAESWIKPENEFVSIGGGKEKTVNFLINIPGEAYPGFYYLGLAAQERNLNVGQIGLTSRLVTLLSLQVAGEAQEILRINNWEKQPNSGIWAFSAILENKGNVDLPLRGEIVVRNWLKKEAGRQIVYLGNNLLPNTARNLSLNFNQEKLPWSPWYWAGLEANYGRAGAKTAAAILILDLPARILVFAGILVIIILVLFKVFLKRHKISM